MGDDEQGVNVSPRFITASPRKFSAYVLDPQHASGKAAIVVDRFGYRPNSQEDATALASSYVAQASECLRTGNFRLGMRDEFGHRYTIPILIRQVTVLSGWLLRPDGTLALVTPFAGFAKVQREGQR